MAETKETTGRKSAVLYGVLGGVIGLLLGLGLSGYAVNGQHYRMMRTLGFGTTVTHMQNWVNSGQAGWMMDADTANTD